MKRDPKDEGTSSSSADDWITSAGTNAPTNATKTRATDHVFVQLAGAILRGQLAANHALPPERDLATRFNISRVLVREAIHRLKELGLVRVKQGGQTIVLDPDQATDPRVTALVLELSPPDGSGSALKELRERHLAHFAALLELAEDRMVSSEIVALETLVAEYIKAGAPRGPGFAADYWTAVATSTRNKILLRETRWWMSVTTASNLEHALVPFDHEQTVRLYEETTARLRRREHAAAYFLEQIRRAFQASR